MSANPVAEGPLKFRCHGCGCLLGVSRSRAGRLTRCPKCGVELIVPLPAEATGSGEPDRPDPTPAPIAAEPGPEPSGLTIELTEVNAENFRDLAGSDMDFLRLAGGPISPDPAPVAPNGPPAEKADDGVAEGLPWQVSPPEPIAPERPSAVSRAPSSPRGRDVVLPRSVVLAWMVFALIGMACAFLAGYVIGRVGLPAIQVGQPPIPAADS